MTSKSKAADVTMNAHTLAVLMTDPPSASHGLGLGRNWTAQDGAKRVRSIARDTIDRFVNRTGRTAHAYSLTEARTIVAEAQQSGQNAGQSADAVREAFGSSKPATPRKARKAAPVAPEASQDES